MPYPFYVGVAIEGSTIRNEITLLLQNTLAYLTGDVVLNATKNECDYLAKHDMVIFRCFITDFINGEVLFLYCMFNTISMYVKISWT